MKRLARLGLVTGLAATMLLPFMRQEAAFATPFSDVPANHWAYQYIQSLAADGVIDGYPDGKFKGDRPNRGGMVPLGLNGTVIRQRGESKTICRRLQATQARLPRSVERCKD